MNREKIIKEFSQLYIGQDSRRLAKQYFQKKKKENMKFLSSVQKTGKRHRQELIVEDVSVFSY